MIKENNPPSFGLVLLCKGTTFLGYLQIKLHLGVILLFRGVDQGADDEAAKSGIRATIAGAHNNLLVG